MDDKKKQLESKLNEILAIISKGDSVVIKATKDGITIYKQEWKKI